MDDDLVNNIFIACEQSFNDCEDEVKHDTLLTNEIKTWLITNGYDNIVLNVGMLHWLTDLINSNIDC
ncbi:hypothetical protein [Tenacibaculum phage PTm5]|nr:hypothetical protein [Tenacibaculum phage PTm5]